MLLKRFRVELMRWLQWMRWLAALAVAALLVGCVTTFAPQPLEEVPFKARRQTKIQGGLTVTVAVPTRSEAEAIFGVDLASQGMQSVWIEIKNEEEIGFWLLSSGLDPAYFSTSEAAYVFRRSVSAKKWQALDAQFQTLQFRNPVQPGSTVSGFLIVNRDEDFKVVDIDLIGLETAYSFTYVISDPDFKGIDRFTDFANLYTEEEIIHIDDEDELRRALEQLPCCTTNKNGSKEGDPLNLVVIGDRGDVFPAFIRRGWHGTEIASAGAIWRTMKAFISDSRYRYSPISPLYVFGRRQDLAGQKARGTIHERNHQRLWLTPIRFQGKGVWIGQISRDIGVKFTTKTPTMSTHVIDPDVDEARRYLIEDLAYSQALARIAIVSGVGKTSKDEPRLNLVGDPWYSDGLRAVMFFEPRPRTLDRLDFLQWETPPRSKAGDVESAPFDDGSLRERAHTVAEDGVRVSVAVPSDTESKAIYGVDLSVHDIQPVWIEIENGTDRRIAFLPTGLDPEYFSPLEVSFGYRKEYSADARAVLDEHFQRLSIETRIPPHTTVSGFVLTNVDAGMKLVTVDLVSKGWAKSLAVLTMPLGNVTAADRFQRIVGQHADSDLVHFEDESELREILEALPCCTSSESGERGEPLNLVLIGEPEEFLPAFGRRNYGSVSVSPQYLFHRPQDLSGAKRAEWVPAQPHVLRLWLTTFRYRGKHVWVGQVSMPLGGRFASRQGEEKEGQIDPDVDEARNDLLQDLVYSQYVSRIGFVLGVGRVSDTQPRTTPSGSTYHTDGLRAVAMFEHGNVSLAEIGFFDWERLMDHYRQQIGSSPEK